MSEDVLVFSISNSRVALAVCRISDSPQLLDHIVVTDSEGFSQGVVDHLDCASKTIADALNVLIKRKSFKEKRIRLSHQAFVILNNEWLCNYSYESCHYFNGMNRIISENEVNAVIKQTLTIAALPLSEFILIHSPVGYRVNDLEGVRNPLGLEASRLGVTLNFFTMDYSHFKNLQRSFEIADVNVGHFLPKNLMSSEILLTEDEKAQRSILVEIDNALLTVSLWEKNELVESQYVAWGIQDLVKEMSDEWEIEGKVAEEILLQYASFRSEIEFPEERIPKIHKSDEQMLSRGEFHEKFYEAGNRWFVQLAEKLNSIYEQMDGGNAHMIFSGQITLVDGFGEGLERSVDFKFRLANNPLIYAENQIEYDAEMAPILGWMKWYGQEQYRNRLQNSKTGWLKQGIRQVQNFVANYF